MNTLSDSFWLALQLVAGADATVWGIGGLSLRVSLLACVFGALLGLGLGAWLAVTRFRGHGLLVWGLNTLLAMPSVVVGLLVYLLLSRAGPLGSWGILFTPTAMVVAQSILVVPLIAALSRRLVLDALAEGGEQLQSLGAGRPAQALCGVTIRLGMSGASSGWSAVSEAYEQSWEAAAEAAEHAIHLTDKQQRQPQCMEVNQHNNNKAHHER
jgi:ABC-type tungstate transport system substrate-binding protein